MGRVKELSYNGYLNHDGSFLVAKSNIKQTIINVNRRGKTPIITVRGNKGSYDVQIHKNLKPVTDFIEKGDCAYIKWKMGTAWIVGFQKRKAYLNEQESIQAKHIGKNGECDWNSFMREVDVE